MAHKCPVFIISVKMFDINNLAYLYSCATILYLRYIDIFTLVNDSSGPCPGNFDDGRSGRSFLEML